MDAAFGEPRLRTYDDDAALVADTFPDLEGLLVQNLSIKVTRSQTWHETFAKELVQDSEHMDVVHGWIWYCIAFELEPVAAALLFVKVLCYRFQGCDQEALALLLRVQIETFKVGPVSHVWISVAEIGTCRHKLAPKLTSRTILHRKLERGPMCLYPS